MASFTIAYAWMMDNEDPRREYRQVPDAPAGAYAISGINSHVWPDQFAVIAGIRQAYRGPAVQAFYSANFWRVPFGQLLSDDIAKRVFDASVNMGPGTAVKLIQRAINSLKPGSLPENGGWGSATVSECNAADPSVLTVTFIAARCQHYRDIVAANPDRAKYLTNWLVRARK